MEAFVGLSILLMLVFSVGIAATRKPETPRGKNMIASIGSKDATHGSVAVVSDSNSRMEQARSGISPPSKSAFEASVHGDNRRKTPTQSGT
jgi:hypothetical protein